MDTDSDDPVSPSHQWGATTETQVARNGDGEGSNGTTVPGRVSVPPQRLGWDSESQLTERELNGLTVGSANGTSSIGGE